MKVQAFNQLPQPKALAKPPEAPNPKENTPSKDDTFVLSNRKENLEIVSSALVIGLVCGVSAHTQGAGWGAATSIAASTVGTAAYGYASSKQDGYRNLGALAGGVAGATMGVVGATGAAIGSMTGHPIVGGLVAGGVMAAYGLLRQNR